MHRRLRCAWQVLPRHLPLPSRLVGHSLRTASVPQRLPSARPLRARPYLHLCPGVCGRRLCRARLSTLVLPWRRVPPEWPLCMLPRPLGRRLVRCPPGALACVRSPSTRAALHPARHYAHARPTCAHPPPHAPSSAPLPLLTLAPCPTRLLGPSLLWQLAALLSPWLLGPRPLLQRHMLVCAWLRGRVVPAADVSLRLARRLGMLRPRPLPRDSVRVRRGVGGRRLFTAVVRGRLRHGRLRRRCVCMLPRSPWLAVPAHLPHPARRGGLLRPWPVRAPARASRQPGPCA